MTPWRQETSRELERIRREARERVDAGGQPALVPPASSIPEAVPPLPALESAAPFVPPAIPDVAPVNESWRASPAKGGILRRWLERVLAPRLDAQVAFNARQVQLDNALLVWLQTCLTATQAQNDRLHQAATRRMNEIDERHQLLQDRLVVHVHELVRRIDFVLEAAERSRLSGQSDVHRLATRIEEIERQLGPR